MASEKTMASDKNIRVYAVADSIVSPLGLTSSENLDAVLCGRSGVSLHPAGTLGIPEPFAASLFDREKMREVLENEGIYDPGKYSFLEMISILSAKTALRETSIDPSSDDVIFIFSSTKGNIDELENVGDKLPERTAGIGAKLPLASSARRIAEWFGNGNDPVVISNACISGVCAEIEALRLLRSGAYRRAVVIGADCQSRFIISGFQSFKALSAGPCRPFDRDRRGLNLGEAAATVVLEAAANTVAPEADALRTAPEAAAKTSACRWEILDGCIRNDANHISGPSRTGEGSWRALEYLLQGGFVTPDELVAVNVHGTATAYNDEMESIALSRAGLSDVPINSLKGFFGHTMGAAGVLETVISMHAIGRGLVLPTRGFENMGVSCPVNISNELRHTDKHAFIKLISGFGGCNAAVAFRLGDSRQEQRGVKAQPGDAVPDKTARIKILGRIDINPERISIDGNSLEISGSCSHPDSGYCESSDKETSPSRTPRGRELLTAAYRSLGTDYPKFFKMDTLSRLGFVASELLLNAVEPGDRPASRGDRAVIFWNRTASLCNDLHYERTVSDPQNWFPSPALFVYTLPNIVCGEIAIRNRWYGETLFLIADACDESSILESVRREFDDRGMNSALCGWLECPDDDVFEAHLFLVERG